MNKKFTHADHKNSIKSNSPLPIIKYIQVERYFTRPLAFLIVRAVYNTKVTPNSLTYISFIFGLLAAAAYLGGNHLFFILGGVMGQVTSIFDCADGQLARVKNMGSRYGAHLDLFLDRLTESIAYLCIVIGYFRYSGSWEWLIIGLASLGLYNLQINLYYIFKQYHKMDKLGDRSEAHGFAVFVVFVLSIANRLEFIILGMSVMTILNIGYRMYTFLWKERRLPSNKNS